MVHRRSFLFVTFLLVASMPMLWAGAAYACNCTCGQDASLGYVDTAVTSFEPGSRVAVSGNLFHPEQPVDIRWNSINGSVIGAAVGPTFVVKVTIPNVAPGTYDIVVPVRSREGMLEKVAALKVDVLPASISQAPEPVPVTPTETQPVVPSAPVAVAPVIPVPASSPPAPEPVLVAPTVAAVEPVAAEPLLDPLLELLEPVASVPSTPAAATTPAPPRTGSVPSGAAPVAVAEATVAVPAAAVQPQVGVNLQTTPAEPPATPAARSATGDLWSGFTSGSPRGPSLIDQPSAQGTPTALTIGVAILGLGLVTLLAGSTVAVWRRRLATTGERSGS